ncbi:hypothetical protein Sviol_50690 [Streptomyces violascens]|uniref:Transposase n=1 Tax=Streptomyces violascens TaxID=67381 RepID=A0ABQ3QTR2_9ACTN|nr:hypothetical protein Sviol_50690 [Streptomyces violascens]
MDWGGWPAALQRHSTGGRIQDRRRDPRPIGTVDLTKPNGEKSRPPTIGIVRDNFSPHPTTKKGTQVGDSAAASNVAFVLPPTNNSWLNRIEAQFTVRCYFALDGTDHASRKEQGSMIRCYIIRRNKCAADERLLKWSTGRTLPDAAPGVSDGSGSGSP